MSNKKEAKMIANIAADKELDNYCLEIVLQQACVNKTADSLEDIEVYEGRVVGEVQKHKVFDLE